MLKGQRKEGKISNLKDFMPMEGWSIIGMVERYQAVVAWEA